MKILIVVDPQEDFMMSDGALSVKGALEIIPNINKLLMSDKFDLKIITQDWHPVNHMSFADTHGAGLFTKHNVIPAGQIAPVEQMMWPRHCLAGTEGAKICSGIFEQAADMIIRKGTDANKENYSFLEYVVGGSVDNFVLTPYYNMFRTLQAEYYICGVATDYCVKQTALSIRNHLNEEVVLVYDAMAAVDPIAGDNFIASWPVIVKTENII